MKKFWAILILIGASLLVYINSKVQHSDTAVDAPVRGIESPETVTEHIQEPSSYDVPQTDDPRLTRLADGSVHFNPAVESSRTLDQTTDPNEAVIVIDQLISHYRYAYKENPVGSENTEIVEQLLGKNPKRIVFLDPKSKALKDKQLLDQWEQPYFFHALSGQEMEIRSAGPDGQHWTKDDIVSNN